MAYLDDTGLAYFWGKIKAYIAALLAPKADDADVVHRTGDETVGGFKSFVQPSVVLQHPDIELTNDSSEYPNENKYLEIFLADKNYDPSTSTDPNRAPAVDETRFGEIQWCRRPNGIDTFELTIRELDGDGNGILANLGIGYNPSNGIFNGYCPSTSELRTSGTDIVTRDWIPKDTRIVHTTGNEYVGGIKTFEDNILLKATDIVRNTAPSSNIANVRIACNDNNDKPLFGIYDQYYTDKTHATWLISYDGNSTGYSHVALGCGFGSNGESFCRASSNMYATNKTDVDIVTRNWWNLRRDTATIYPSRNLNDMVDSGIYYLIDDGTGWTNLPTGWVNGILRVYSDANHSHVKQIIYRYGSLDVNDHHTCVREYNGTSWSSWVRYITFNDTVPIANGGTGATDRLNAVKNLFNSSVGNNTTDFLVVTSGFASVGYAAVNNVKSVLGLGSAAYTASTAYAAANHNHNSAYVALTGNQTVAGTKTFTSVPVIVGGNNVYPDLKSPNYNYNGTIPSASFYAGFQGKDKNNSTVGWWNVQHSSSGNSFCELGIYLRYSVGTALSVRLYVNSDGGIKAWRCEQNNTVSLGSSSNKWTVVYATTGTINTSDARLKSEIGKYSDSLLDAWEGIEFVSYKLNDSIAEKGADRARVHGGVVAQQVESVLRQGGVDPARYGFFCFDSWDAQEEVREEDGHISEYAREAGDQYSIRYEELLCIEAAYQRRENARLKKRVADLEERLAALELRLGSE